MSTPDQEKIEATHVPGMSDADGNETEAAQRGGQPTPAKSGSSEKPRKVKRLGDFEVSKKLGQGGMGEVYLAHQISLDRPVALKTLSKELAKKDDFVKRFQREAKSMAKLDHPNAVKVYAVDSISGIHFAAIEFIDGQSMQDWMDELGHREVGDALHIILASADALKVAHDLNLIHRDIKPDNILVTKTGMVKVADFGLAKALDDEDVSMTQSGTGLGTPLYMAPEQARNAKYVDHRTDIYALGSTLYYFLTGELPFKGESTLELIMAKEKGIFKSARKLNPKVTERLGLMIDKMIAKDPNHRYGDCGDIIRDLEGLGIHHQSLSFIDHPNKSVRASGNPSPSASPAKPKSLPSQPATPAPQAQTTSSGEKIWEVQYPDSNGRLKKAKLSTGKIKQAIKAGMIDTRAKTHERPEGPLVPLAQIPEFETPMQGLMTRKAADKRSAGMAEIYDKIDRQDKFRRRFGFLKNWFNGLKGGVGLIIYLAVIAGAGFAAWKYGWPMVQDMMNGEAESAVTSPAE
jgi:serine/threonine-protein kinase